VGEPKKIQKGFKRLFRKKHKTKTLEDTTRLGGYFNPTHISAKSKIGGRKKKRKNGSGNVELLHIGICVVN